MRNYFKRRKSQKLYNEALVLWIEDLDDMIARLDEAITDLSQDLQDLTDFVEAELD